MGTKVKISGSTKVKVKKKPVKAGSTNTKGGGIFTAKTAAIVRKRRRKAVKKS
jgi:hypothetical protein